MLFRSDQGCAWLSGKKIVLAIQHDRPLSQLDLARIYRLKSQCNMDVMVFSPFASAPEINRPGLNVVVGEEFLSWMSVLDSAPVVNLGTRASQNCSCGAPREERVSRAGDPLFICSRYPDCREVVQAEFEKVATAKAA